MLFFNIHVEIRPHSVVLLLQAFLLKSPWYGPEGNSFFLEGQKKDFLFWSRFVVSSGVSDVNLLGCPGLDETKNAIMVVS